MATIKFKDSTIDVRVLHADAEERKTALSCRKSSIITVTIVRIRPLGILGMLGIESSRAIPSIINKLEETFHRQLYDNEQREKLRTPPIGLE